MRFWFTNDDATLTLDKVEKYAARVPMDPKKIKSKVVGKQYAGAIEIAARIVAAGATDGGAAAASINACKEGEGEEQEVWSDDEEAAAEAAESELEQARALQYPSATETSNYPAWCGPDTPPSEPCACHTAVGTDRPPALCVM